MRKIPKTAYFFWSGLMPFLRYMTLFSFRKFNPDWRIELFYPGTAPVLPTWRSADHRFSIDCSENFWGNLTDLNIVTTSLQTLPLRFPESMSDVMKADLLRLYLLSERGGLWSDMDILYFRSVESFFKPTDASAYFCKHRLQNLDGSPSDNPAQYHLIGLLLGAPGNPHFTNLFSKALGFWDPHTYQSLGAHLYKHNVHMDSPDIVNIPMSVVYPSNDVQTMFGSPSEVLQGRIMKETIGWHWFGGNPITGPYQSLLTAISVKDVKKPSMIVNLIRRIQNA